MVKDDRMRSLRLMLLLLGTAVGLRGQVQGIVDRHPKLTMDTTAYPLFLGGEQHSGLRLGYWFSDGLKAEANALYDTYLLESRMRINLLLKPYLTDKLYLGAGAGTEFTVYYDPLATQKPGRWESHTAVGYDLMEHVNLEANAIFLMNKTDKGAFGEAKIHMPQIYTLKGKIKF